MASSTAKKSTLFVIAEQERCRQWWTEEDVEFVSRNEILSGFALHASFESVMLDRPIWTIFEDTGNVNDKVLVTRFRFKNMLTDREESSASSYFKHPPSGVSVKDTSLGRVLLAPLASLPKVTSKRHTKRASTKIGDYRIPIPDGDFDKHESSITTQFSLLQFYRHLSPAGGFISLDAVALQLTKDSFCSAFHLDPSETATLAEAVHDFQSRVQNALIALSLLKMKKADGNFTSDTQASIRQFQYDFNLKSEALRTSILAKYAQEHPSDTHGAVLRTEGLMDYKTWCALYGYVRELKANLEMLGFMPPVDPLKTPKRLKSIFKNIRTSIHEVNASTSNAHAAVNLSSSLIGASTELGSSTSSASSALSSIPAQVDEIAQAQRSMMDPTSPDPSSWMKEVIERLSQAASTSKSHHKSSEKKHRSRRHSGPEKPTNTKNMVVTTIGSNGAPTTSNSTTTTAPGSMKMTSTGRAAVGTVSSAIDIRGSNERSAHVSFASGSLERTTSERFPPSSSPNFHGSLEAQPVIFGSLEANRSATDGFRADESTGSPKTPTRQLFLPSTSSQSVTFGNNSSPTTPPDTPKRSSTTPTLTPRSLEVGISPIALLAKNNSKAPSSDTPALSSNAAGSSAPMTSSSHATGGSGSSLVPLGFGPRSAIDVPSVVPATACLIVFDRQYHESSPGWENEIEIVESKVAIGGYRLFIDPSHALSRTRPSTVLVKGDSTTDIVYGMSIRLKSRHSDLLPLWDYYTRAMDSSNLFSVVDTAKGSVLVDRLSDTDILSKGLVLCPNGRFNPHISKIRIQATLQRLGCASKDFVFSLLNDNRRSQDQVYLKYKLDRGVPIEEALYHVVRTIQVCLVALNCLSLTHISPWYSNYVVDAVIKFEKDYELAFGDTGKKFVMSGGNMTFTLYDELLLQTQQFHKALIDLGFPVKCSPFDDIALFSTYTAAYHSTQEALVQSLEGSHSTPLTPLQARKALPLSKESTMSPSPSGSKISSSTSIDPSASGLVLSRFGTSSHAETDFAVGNQEIEFGSSLASKYKEALAQHEELQTRYQNLEESFLQISNDAAEANTALQYFEDQYKESIQNYDLMQREYDAMKRLATENEDAIQGLVQHVASLETKLQELQRIAQRSLTGQILWYLILMLLYILLLPALGATWLADLFRQKRYEIEITEETSIRARLHRYAQHQMTKLERIVDELERKVVKLTGLETLGSKEKRS